VAAQSVCGKNREELFVGVEYKLETDVICVFKLDLSVVRNFLGIHFSSVLGCSSEMLDWNEEHSTSSDLFRKLPPHALEIRLPDKR